MRGRFPCRVRLQITNQIAECEPSVGPIEKVGYFDEDEFGRYAVESLPSTLWIEPLWKMLLSNKALLAVLWEMHPGHPNLLPAFLDQPGILTEYVRKPKLGREGANIQIVQDGEVVQETDGIYADSPRIYQELSPLPNFNGRYPVLGSWMVNGYACGLGIREDAQPITQNTSRFVPHIIGA